MHYNIVVNHFKHKEADMIKMLRKTWNDDRGISPIIEYTLGVAIVALLAAPVIKQIATTVTNKLNDIDTAIKNAGT